MTSRRVILAALAALALVSLVVVVRRLDQPLHGPQPVAWDREACAQCRMLVSDPGFAAQIVDGTRVLTFDDPGCLFEHLAASGATGGELWFHHRFHDRWLPGDRVGFVYSSPSPMGHDLGAVDATVAGAIPLGEARGRARAAR